MSGEPLNCVLQVIYAKRLGEISRDALEELTVSLTDIPYLRSSELKFHQTFKDKTVDLSFDNYKKYVNSTLKPEDVPINLFHDDIENSCWEKCKEFYAYPVEDEQDVKKIWMICNRLVMENSFPPVIFSGDARWFLGQLFEHLADQKIPELTRDATFKQILQKIVSQGVQIQEIRTSIDNLYRLLVIEESKTGLVKSRSRMQANWTAWSTKWCTATSRKIFFHDKPLIATDCHRKGQLFIGKRTKVEKLAAGIDISGRFRISNGQAEAYEIALGNDKEREAWILAIEETKKVDKDSLTPVQQLIKKMSKQHRAMFEIQASFRKRTMEINPNTPNFSNGTVKDNKTKEINVIKANKDKMKGIFMKIDTNGNGFIERNEFAVFIASMGLNMSEKELNIVFNSVDKNSDNALCYDEFEAYLTKQVLSETEATDGINAMRVAFMEADRNSSGKIDFQEFSDYMWEQKRAGRMMKFQDALAQMQKMGSGEVDIHQFEELFLKSGSGKDLTFDRSQSQIDELQDELRQAYDDTDADELVKMLNDRWKGFVDYDRTGKTGKSVMTSDNVVKDFVPGEYNLVDMACFSNLPPLIPNHTVVKNSKWVSSNVQGTSGKVILPSDFDGNISTETGTNEFLRYYGCSFADSGSQQVSLLHRHSIVDFTYENDYFVEYSKKHGGMETHNFSHLDCPMSRESGIMVLGKYMDNGDLHITGFKIPQRHVLYVPRGCIHSNDHLVGTWRTMLSDEATIDHVKLEKECKTEGKSTVTFTFVD